ncbi:MAG TPA: histidine kinase dimerization/phosphoacceptor domain -containing protein [Anaerolineae bacterium]|nr:histidine kinase dimerization/phosphoacceptor domain -containing protein [Anaerolineae bacterium]
MAHEQDFFKDQIDTVQEWLALRQRQQGANGETPGSTAEVDETLLELSVTLEELQAANEELSQQNQELIETRQAEEMERRRYQNLFDFAPDSYLVTDVEGVIREANRAASILFRIHRQYLPGKPLLLFVAPEERRTFLIKLMQLRAEGGLQNWELPLQPRAQLAFLVGVTVLADQDSAGKVIGLRWLLRDITAAKRVEAELQQYRDRFEGLLESRTAELQQELSERRLAEAQAKLALREKEVLLQEIQRRVKNNLQLVLSLLELQSAAIQNPDLLHIFQDSKDRLRSIIFIHDYLYQAQALTQIDLTHYIHSITGHLDRAYNGPGQKVCLTIQVAEILLGVNVALPCGLIINELVSNAFKYAFPPEWRESQGRQAEIVIRLWPAEGRLILLVSDNGVGLPPDIDIYNSSTLGLQLVNMLTQQLKGTLELECTAGTTFKLTWVDYEQSF